MNTPVNLKVDFSSPSAFGHCDIILTVAAQTTKREFFRFAVDREQLQRAIAGSWDDFSTKDKAISLGAKLIR